tara:strand:+ start:185 stop:607 length:423 start_codon:yes stop_codon:yes gene_type:complete
MVNLDHIFHLFSSNDDLQGIASDKAFIDFKNTPTYWVGMYKKLILNHVNFNKKIIKFFQKSNKELDLGDVKEAGEYVTYNRAWSYIKKIDISKKEHLKGIDTYADEYLDTSLKLGISFYIETEEYEKCAHLQKILDYLSK